MPKDLFRAPGCLDLGGFVAGDSQGWKGAPRQAHGLTGAPFWRVVLGIAFDLPAHSTGCKVARMDRWFGVGRSAHRDATTAGREAAEEALQRRSAKLLVVFASDAYDSAALLAGIRATASDTPLIGCSTAGEISRSGPGDDSVVVFALGGEGITVATAAAAESSLRASSEAVAHCIRAVEERPHRALFLLADGLAGDQQEVVRGAFSIVGAEVPLIGGCAGDNLKMRQTLQFHGDSVLSDAVVAAAIGSSAPIGIGVHHGWRRVGEPMVVTASEGNLVVALDDEPALNVYLRGLNPPDQARTEAAAFTQFALTHPLGLERRSGEEVRFVAGADFEARTLICVAHVPQGGLTWFMEGNYDSVLAATDAACVDAIEQLGGMPPMGVVAFDCIARRGVLGPEGIEDEVARITAHAHGGGVAGFYTYGEIARTIGTRGFHNQTLVIMAMA